MLCFSRGATKNPMITNLFVTKKVKGCFFMAPDFGPKNIKFGLEISITKVRVEYFRFCNTDSYSEDSSNTLRMDNLVMLHDI